MEILATHANSFGQPCTTWDTGLLYNMGYMTIVQQGKQEYCTSVIPMYNSMHPRVNLRYRESDWGQHPTWSPGLPPPRSSSHALNWRRRHNAIISPSLPPSLPPPSLSFCLVSLPSFATDAHHAPLYSNRRHLLLGSSEAKLFLNFLPRHFPPSLHFSKWSHSSSPLVHPLLMLRSTMVHIP